MHKQLITPYFLLGIKAMGGNIAKKHYSAGAVRVDKGASASFASCTLRDNVAESHYSAGAVFVRDKCLAAFIGSTLSGIFSSAKILYCPSGHVLQ